MCCSWASAQGEEENTSCMYAPGGGQYGAQHSGLKPPDEQAHGALLSTKNLT